MAQISSRRVHVHEHSKVYISHVPHISIAYLFCNIIGVKYEVNSLTGFKKY